MAASPCLETGWRLAGDWREIFPAAGFSVARVIYAFDDFELDSRKMELARGGRTISMEPQVFALLLLLVENRERVLPREEIIENVWEGRAVSDSALDSRVKTARQLLGDDGKAQRYIRTVRGHGFRFVAAATESAATAQVVAAEETPCLSREDAAKPSIAVLPFRYLGTGAEYATMAEAIPDEIIAELSRLRWLFVIARGSSFRIRSENPDPLQVARLLGVHYFLSGSVEVAGSSITVAVQLVDTRSSEVAWSERFATPINDVHDTRATIVARVVAALELQIPDHEARVARSRSPENLDAWSTYHLGLQHMFRFNRADNAAATRLFERAVQLDPAFARAHAGLSFVHFQNAFLRYTTVLAEEIRLARRFATRSVELDPLDPFANLTMGRSFWLEGNLAASEAWIERATSISPSYAQAVYARAWTHALSGRGASGRADADTAIMLSPLDPLYYAMAATRALSHIACGESSDAARWAERAALAPGAHVLIAVIAVAAHALDGDAARAAEWATNVFDRSGPGIGDDFFRSFPFSDPTVRERIASALRGHGI